MTSIILKKRGFTLSQLAMACPHSDDIVYSLNTETIAVWIRYVTKIVIGP